MIAPGYDLPITAATTTTCIGGVMTGYVAPTVVDAMSVVDSPICPIVGSGVATIVGHSVSSKGAP